MPLIVPADLSIRWMLEAEGVFLIDRSGALRQDCRPLRILVIDLDGTTADAVDSILALLSHSPLQIEIVVATLPGMNASRSTAKASVPWSPTTSEVFDAALLTDRKDDGGLPHESEWWDEIRDFLDWSAEHVRAQLHLGWAAYAALAHVHGIEVSEPPQRREACLTHRVVRRQSYLLRGVDDAFTVYARWQRRLPKRFLIDAPGLELLAESTDGEPYLLRTYDRRSLYALHQPLADGGGDGAAAPRLGASHAALLISNWLNYYLYQPTSLPRPGLGAHSQQR
jgi:homoserine O-succinyltransferase/O-acetyltransferase